LVDFNSNGTLDQTYRNDQAVHILSLDHDSNDPMQRAAVNAHTVAFLNIGTPGGGEPGLEDAPDGVQFSRSHRAGGSSHAHDSPHSGCYQYRKPVFGIKTAEQIAWKEWEVQKLEPV
jgi:hypothetical protein